MVVLNETDWLLQRLVSYVNGSNSTIPITISTDGLLISGTLVSRQTYVKDIYEKMVPKKTVEIKPALLLPMSRILGIRSTKWYW